MKLMILAAAAALVATGAAPPHYVASEAPAQRIEVTATRFSYAPDSITVKKGQPVELVLKSGDVAHGLKFRELGVDVKADKGKTSTVDFTPEKTGDFVGHCSVFCGRGHGSMSLTLHVVE